MERTNKSKVVKAARNRAKAKPERENPYDGDLTHIISTGSTLLDLTITGGRIRGGGVPGGIVAEIFGPNQGGKTVFLSELAGDVQRKGGQVKFWDAEARLNKKFAEMFDLKIDDCGYGVPEQVSDVFQPLLHWLPDGPACIGNHNRRKKKCRECDSSEDCKDFDVDERPIHGCFIDSFAALSGEMEVGDEIDKRGSARAKDFSQWLRKLGPKITKNNWLVVGSNQIRDKQDAASFGKKTTTPCGKAIPHHCSLRMEIVPIEYLNETKKVNGKDVKMEYGVRAKVKIEKSTVWKPHGIAEVIIIYDYGIDDIRANLQYLKKYSGEKNYWTEDSSINDAIDTVERDESEGELKEAVIDLWEEIQAKFKVDRKKKRR